MEKEYIPFNLCETLVAVYGINAFRVSGGNLAER